MGEERRLSFDKSKRIFFQNSRRFAPKCFCFHQEAFCCEDIAPVQITLVKDSGETVIALFVAGKIVALQGLDGMCAVSKRDIINDFVSKEIGRAGQLLDRMHGGIAVDAAAKKQDLAAGLV